MPEGARGGAITGRAVEGPRALDAWAAGFGALVLVAALAGIDLGGWWLRRAGAPVVGEAAVAVGHRVVTVPRAWLARPAPGVEVGDRLDLAVPAAGPAGRAGPVIFVTATPSGAPEPGPAQLYGRFLTAEATPMPGGLVRRRFRAGAPFEGEELYLAGSDGRFAARCAPGGGPAGSASGNPVGAHATPVAGVAGECIALVSLGGLDLRVRFGADRLGGWEATMALLERVFGD